MSTPLYRHARASLAAVALLAALAAPAFPAVPARAAAHGASVSRATVRRTRHIRVYGYVTALSEDNAGGGYLDVYSKTRGTRKVLLTRDTVVKKRTQVVPRAALHSGGTMYVMVTCERDKDGALVALTVHIENRHRRRRHH